jgi:hypothetical protein
MNVLLYVMTMLMVLALMSYARLETYRSAQIFQTLFAHYMEKDERGEINAGFKRQYESEKGSSREGGDKSQPKINASPRISLSIFLNKQQQAAQPDQFHQTIVLLRNLLQVLYRGQPFYEEIIEEKPQFAEELVRSIVSTIDALPQENKPKNMKDLSNLVLSDPKLNEALYKILHGAPEKYEAAAAENEEPKHAVRESVEDKVEDSSQDAALLEAEAQEHTSPKGYQSLADYVTLSSSPQIRIFLASPPVLQALFPNPQTVQEILEMRRDLHRQALHGADLQELENTFKNRFERLHDPAINSALLNFQVSKTDPRKYQ